MFKLFIRNPHKFSSFSASLKLLGLSQGASPDEIKKKYYQLAKQYHPDVNKQDNAHQKFTEITKAYNFILEKENLHSEENQRSSSQIWKNGKKYNPYETKSQKRSKTNFQEDWQDFETFDEYYRSYKKYKKPKRGQDIYVNLSALKSVKFSRKINCSSCTNQELQTCISCGGKGQIFHRKNKQKIQCPNCSGFGYKLDCPECNGTRAILKDVEQQVYVEKGTHDKSILRVKNNGHQGYKHSNGDLYLTILIEKSQKMKMDGNNIHSEIEIEYLTAVFGGQIQIETVQGLRKIAVPAGTQSGHEMRLFNYGVKSAFSARVGDQIVKFKIKMPKNLSAHQKKLMDELSREQSREVF